MFKYNQYFENNHKELLKLDRYLNDDYDFQAKENEKELYHHFHNLFLLDLDHKLIPDNIIQPIFPLLHDEVEIYFHVFV